MEEHKEENKKDSATQKEKEKEEKGFGKFSFKEIVMLLASGAILVFLGFEWKQIMVDQKSAGPVSYVLPLALMVLFAAFFSLSAMLTTKKLLAWPILAAASFGAIGFVPLWNGSFAAAALVFLSLLSAFYSIHSAYKRSVDFRASAVIRAGLSSVFTALVLMISFYHLQGQILRPRSIIPEGLIKNTVGAASKLVGKQLEERVEGLTQSIGKQITSELPIGPGSGGQGLQGLLGSLPPELLSFLPPELSKMIQGFGAQGGVEEEGAEPQKGVPQKEAKLIDTAGIAEDLATSIQNRVDNIIKPFKPFIPYVFTFFFFLTAKGLSFVLRWPTTLFASIVLKFLTTVGIVRKEKVMIEVERVFF